MATGRIEIRIEEGDLCAAEVDAIVNAANTQLALGAGVAGAIRAQGGPTIQEECDRHGPVELGGAALTGGGELPARHVIHAAAMEPGGAVTESSLRAAVRAALGIARDRGFRTLALPAIGTGVGGFPLVQCARILFEEVEAHGREGATLEQVRFVLFGEPAFRVFEQVHDQARIEIQMRKLREARAGQGLKGPASE